MISLIKNIKIIDCYFLVKEKGRSDFSPLPIKLNNSMNRLIQRSEVRWFQFQPIL